MTKPALALWPSAEGTGRAYRHPFRPGDGVDSKGKPVNITSPSVTTVLKMVAKGDGVVQWAAYQTLQWAIDNASLLIGKSDEQATRWGRWRWKDARDERAEVGTGVHETIEALHTGSWTFPPLDEEQHQIMEQWERLQERYVFTPHRSEFTVWNFAHDYAGTGDGLWDILDTETGEFHENVVIDLKTSKNTWPEHWLQLAALRAGEVIMELQPNGKWVEVPMPVTSGVAIIHLRADHAAVYIDTREDVHKNRFDQFRTYRTLWGLDKDLEALLKKYDTPEPFTGF